VSHTNLWRGLFHASVLVVCTAALALPCTIVGSISPNEMVRRADAIVRAVAVEYATAPANPGALTTGVPDSVVRFKIAEVLKGKAVPQELLLPGYLSERDDFNDHKAPYTFVRPGGRSGSCFANSYRRGAEFLLVLKNIGTSFTVNWYALGPVNEQLKSHDDPWLIWVRQELKKEAALPNQRLQPTARASFSRLSRTRRG